MSRHPVGRRFPASNWERLVSAERRALLDPTTFVPRLGIPPGATVADLGAGPGFFLDALSDAVGPTGQVHALDVSADMIEILRRRGLPAQVTAEVSEENRLPLPDASVDFCLLAFVLHELESPGEFLAEARRILRPDGRLAVLEWVPQEETMGPPASERLSIDDARDTLQRSGFATIEHGLANPSNYFLVSRRD